MILPLNRSRATDFLFFNTRMRFSAGRRPLAGSRVTRCNMYPGMERTVIRDSRYRKPVVMTCPCPEEKVDCMMGTVLYNLYNIYRIQG